MLSRGTVNKVMNIEGPEFVKNFVQCFIQLLDRDHQMHSTWGLFQLILIEPSIDWSMPECQAVIYQGNRDVSSCSRNNLDLLEQTKPRNVFYRVDTSYRDNKSVVKLQK